MKEKKEEKNNTNENTELKPKKKFNVPWRTLAVIAFLIIFILGTMISIRSKYLNVKQVGENYTSVLITDLKNTYTIAITVFFIVYLLIYINNRIIKRGLKKFFDEDNKPMPKLPNKSLALVGGIIASIIIPSIIGKQYAMFVNSTEFGGNPDPIFHLDIGYYMFKLPFIKSCLMILIWLFICLIIYTAIYYVLTLNTCLDGVSSESEYLLEGSTRGQALVIDGKVLTTDGTAKPGEIVKVKVEQNFEYDFVGPIVENEK